MLNSDWEPDFSPRTYQRLINIYDDSIRYGDVFLKELLRDLAGDDPVFVVHADHGEEFGEHGRYGHQPFLTEELIHVPLVISGINQSRRVQIPVGLHNLAPTIAGIAGVEHPFPERNLLGLDEEERPWVTSKVFADGQRRAAIRTRRHKYFREKEREELVEINSGSRRAVDDMEKFARILDAHVATEHEKRGIWKGAEQVIVEKDV